MSIIETLDTAGFTEYLKKYGNTICGRHPIGVLLNVNIYFYLFKIMFLLEFFMKDGGPRPSDFERRQSVAQIRGLRSIESVPLF